MDRILIPLDLYKLPDPPKRPKVPLLIDGEAVKEIDLSVNLETHLDRVYTERDTFARRYRHLHSVVAAASTAKQKRLKERHPVDRSQPLIAINSGARRIFASDEPKPPSLPSLVICPDASGGVGGLEAAFQALEYPCFILDPLQDLSTWNSSSLQEIAVVGAEYLKKRLPKGMRIIFAGIGFGGAVAHALILQAQHDDIGTRDARPLILFEGAAPLIDDGAAVDWIQARERRLLSQIAAQAFDLAVSNGRRALQKEPILVRLSLEKTAEGIQKLLGKLCPTGDDPIGWSAAVEATMLRFALLRGLTRRYNPDAVGPYTGQATALLQHARGHGCATCLARGGPDGMWASIVRALHPLAVFVLPRRLLWGEGEVASLEDTLRYSMRLQDETFRARANKLVAALEDEAKIQALIKEDEAQQQEQEEGGGHYGEGQQKQQEEQEHDISLVDEEDSWEDVAQVEKENPPSRRKYYVVQNGVTSSSREEKDEEEEEEEEGEEGEPPTFCIVHPLNPSSADYLRIGESWQGPLPVWMLHTECGDILNGQKTLAAWIDRPCFGLAMGPDAIGTGTTLEELAEHYCCALESLQCGPPPSPFPAGHSSPSDPNPFLILATSSTSGAAVAHAMGLRMQRAGRPCALILADCAPGWDAVLEERMLLGGPLLHAPDETSYVLFYFLSEFAALGGGMEAFSQRMREAYTAWEQLAIVDSYRPDPVNGTEAEGRIWDAVLYDMLQSCKTLKHMMAGRDADRRAPGSRNGDDDHGVFKGAVALLPPRGREGLVMTMECRQFFDFPGGRVARIDLPCAHTQCIMNSDGREVTGGMIEDVCVKLEAALTGKRKEEEGEEEMYEQ